MLIKSRGKLVSVIKRLLVHKILNPNIKVIVAISFRAPALQYLYFVTVVHRADKTQVYLLITR